MAISPEAKILPIAATLPALVFGLLLLPNPEGICFLGSIPFLSLLGFALCRMPKPQPK